MSLLHHVSAGTVARDGADIVFDRTGGGGPAVVLVHSGVTDRRSWNPVVERLGGRVDTIALDLRGFGDSVPTSSAAFSHADDVVAVLDALRIERAVLAGNSYGGLVALDAASRHRDRVAALVLLAPPLPDHEFSQRMEDFGAAEEAALEAGDLDAAVALNVDMWAGRASRELVAAAQHRIFELQEAVAWNEREPAPDLGRITMPATVLAGTADVPDFVQIAERLGRELADARLELVPGAGHLLPLEEPDLVDRTIAGVASAVGA